MSNEEKETSQTEEKTSEANAEGGEEQSLEKKGSGVSESDLYNPETQETPEDNPAAVQLGKVARFYTLLHLALAPITLFFGNAMVAIIDKIGGWFDMPVIDTGRNAFWIIPIIGLFYTLAYNSFRVWRDPENNRDKMQLVISAHAIIGLSFFIAFFVDIGSLAYLMAGLFEFALAGLAGYFWWAAKPVKE